MRAGTITPRFFVAPHKLCRRFRCQIIARLMNTACQAIHCHQPPCRMPTAGAECRLISPRRPKRRIDEGLLCLRMPRERPDGRTVDAADIGRARQRIEYARRERANISADYLFHDGAARGCRLKPFSFGAAQESSGAPGRMTGQPGFRRRFSRHEQRAQSRQRDARRRAEEAAQRRHITPRPLAADFLSLLLRQAVMPDAPPSYIHIFHFPRRRARAN